MRQSGQALLIVLLSMAVVLTIVLSIFSNSVTDIAVTTSEAESLRAFSAAEAGIEKALVALAPQSGSFGEDAFQTSVTNFAEGLTSFAYPMDLASGDGAVLWFVSHDSNDKLSCSDSSKPCFKGSKVYILQLYESLLPPYLGILFVYPETETEYSRHLLCWRQNQLLATHLHYIAFLFAQVANRFRSSRRKLEFQD